VVVEKRSRRLSVNLPIPRAGLMPAASTLKV
jgi:hypothetical protein